MIGPHEIERAVFIETDNCSIRTDVFADQAAGAEALVVEVLSDPVAILLVMGVDRLTRLGYVMIEFLAQI